MKELSLLAVARERNGTVPNKPPLHEERNRQRNLLSKEGHLSYVSFRADRLLFRMFSRSPERIGPGADNKAKMAEDRKNESDAGCLKPATNDRTIKTVKHV